MQLGQRVITIVDEEWIEGAQQWRIIGELYDY
jgi:hypothetical protein